MVKRPRSWVKIYCYETLHGSVSYQLTPAERYCWIALVAQAGLCTFQEGLISDHDGRPYPYDHIAQEIKVPVELLESTLAKCKEEGRIIENGNGIAIVNWTKYQSEYQRQKQYRQRGSHLDETPEQRAERLATSHNRLVTEDYMQRWEAAHPGQTYPGRAMPESDKGVMNEDTGTNH